MSTTRTLIVPAIAAFALLGSAALSPAFAHGDNHPKHGGQVRMSGETLFELVKSPKGVDLYVVDDEEPIQASGYAAKLVITAGGKKAETPMKAVRGNQFTAPGLKLAPGSKVAVTLTNNASSTRTFTTFTVK